MVIALHELEKVLDMTPIAKLSRDLQKAATLLTPPQVRWLVDTYYQIQVKRVAANNQVAMSEPRYC
jgi:hypothetical protein